MSNGEGKTSVVVVDDDDAVRQLLVSLLEADGRFEIVGEGRNGEEAVAVTSDKEPDLVVLDYLMPFKRGDDAAELIRRALPDIHIVALSAVLDHRPQWADAILRKSDIVEAPDILHDVLHGPDAALIRKNRRQEP
jgi:DNA-binding NarL/FixJ family response regulator